MGAMTLAEFSLLYKYIKDYHGPLATAGRRVKYMYPSIDMRDGKVFAIKIRGFNFEDTTLHTQNEWSDCQKSLYQRCLEFVSGN